MARPRLCFSYVREQLARKRGSKLQTALFSLEEEPHRFCANSLTKAIWFCFYAFVFVSPSNQKVRFSCKEASVESTQLRPVRHCFTSQWWRIMGARARSFLSAAPLVRVLTDVILPKTHNDLIHSEARRTKGDLSHSAHCRRCISALVPPLTFEGTVLVFSGGLASVAQVPLRLSFMPFKAKHLPSAWSRTGPTVELQLQFLRCVHVGLFFVCFFQHQERKEEEEQKTLICNLTVERFFLLFLYTEWRSFRSFWCFERSQPQPVLSNFSSFFDLQKNFKKERTCWGQHLAGGVVTDQVDVDIGNVTACQFYPVAT